MNPSRWPSRLLALPGGCVGVRSNDRHFLARDLYALFRPCRRPDVPRDWYDVYIEESGGGTIWQARQQIWHASSRDEIIAGLYGLLYQRVLASQSAYLVHGGAVSYAEAGVLLVGGSTSGKSTLVSFLALAGLRVLSDDVVSVNTAHGTMSPYPRRLLLRSNSLLLNPELAAGMRLLGRINTGEEELFLSWPAAQPLDEEPADTHLRLLAFPRWTQDGSPMTARELTTGEVAAGVLSQGLNLRVLGRSGVAQAAAIARSVPGWSLEIRNPVAARDWPINELARTV